MYRYLILCISAVCIAFPASAQDIQSHIDYFSDNLSQISTKKSDFSQSFGIQAGENEQCMVWYQKTPSGKGEEERFEFNAADLNENRIEFDTQRDLVVVSASVKGKKDLIRAYEDGEVKGYTDEVELYAASVEEARKLVDELKALAKSCGEKMDKQAGLGSDASKEELLAYLTEHVKEVEINDERIEQSFAFDPQKTSLITYTMTDVPESETSIYRFNAMDLNFAKINFDTDKTQVVIKAETKARRNLIQVEENGELENYSSKMQLISASIENARNVSAVLKALARLSEKEGETAMTLRSDNDPSAAIAYLQEHIGEVVINEDAYRQKFKADPEKPYLVSYEVEDLDKSEIETFSFNLSDLSPSSVEFDVSRNAVYVTAETQGDNKLIQEFEDKVVSGYGNELSIRVDDIESARMLRAQLLQAVKYYKENRTDDFTLRFPNAGPQQAVDYCKANIQKIVLEDESYEQVFREGEEGYCLAEIEVTDVDKGEVEGYSFNWADINPSKISFDTKGDVLFIIAETKRKKELIEVSENGEVEDYERELKIRCTDVESARALAAAWELLARSCGEK